MTINLKVCEHCVSNHRNNKSGYNFGAYASIRNDIVHCRKKWLSAKLSKPPEWCEYRLEHIVSQT